MCPVANLYGRPELLPEAGARHERTLEAAICSTIASIHIANAAEQWATPGKHRHGSHGHRTIQNGFCVKTGYCRASHMLDVQHEVSNLLVQQVPLLLEKVVPVRMVSDNLYRSSL